MKEKFEAAEGTPEFIEPVSMVLAGGTSLPTGFAQLVKQKVGEIELPLNIGDVRMAGENPLQSVARGCLVAAMVDEE